MAVEKAGTTDVEKVRAASKGLAFNAPEGKVTIDGENQHIYKTVRIGKIRADGLIDEVFESDGPIKPDPYLKTYSWAKGLLGDAAERASGERRDDTMDVILNQLFVGLSIGSILLLIALGLTFTFGQMNVINMAHGEFIMAGAYTAYVLQTALGTGAITLAFGLALPVAFVVAGTLGLILEFLVIRRLYGRPLDTLLVTWGVGLMLQQLARDLFGAQNVNVDAPASSTAASRRRRRPVLPAPVHHRLVVLVVIASRSTCSARRPGAGCARSCRTARWRRSAASHDARRPHDVLPRLGPRGPRRRRHHAARPGRSDARPRLHRRRLPGRHRRRPRASCAGRSSRRSRSAWRTRSSSTTRRRASPRRACSCSSCCSCSGARRA